MMKRLFYSTLLLVSSVAQADWLDDVSSSVTTRRHLDIDSVAKLLKAIAIKIGKR